MDLNTLHCGDFGEGCRRHAAFSRRAHGVERAKRALTCTMNVRKKNWPNPRPQTKDLRFLAARQRLAASGRQYLQRLVIAGGRSGVVGHL